MHSTIPARFGLLLLMGLLSAACSDDSDKQDPARVAYRAYDPCSSHQSAGECQADTMNACGWNALELDCPNGVACPEGYCAAPDPCQGYTTQADCVANAINGCD